MLDTSIVATCLYSIAADFKTMESINCVALAYTLSYLGCAVLFARISDVIGRKAAVMLAFSIFIAFSMACGFSQSLTQLIVFRAFQGIGGSGMRLALLPAALPSVTDGLY
jgi:MFS family permease